MHSATFPDHLITKDRLAVALERQIILRYVRDAKTILDVGCGTGETLRWLAGQRSPGQRFVGLEPHPDLFAVAVGYLDAAPGLGFRLGDYTMVASQYDCIYTQRMLIQLPTWEAQIAAIDTLRAHLTPHGRLLCIEPSADGLDRLNAVRMRVGVPAITPPTHATYLPKSWPGDQPVKDSSFGESYSFLSRVVEAYRAQQEGREPIYMDPDSVEGRLCLALPETGDGFGQYHYSVWGAA